jgi:antirestriction protein
MNITESKLNKNDKLPQVYIACLSAYNSGFLHGAWCDATDIDIIFETIKEVIKTSPVSDAEEYAIHDYDNFYGARLGEYPSISELVEAAEFINEYGELGAELINYCFNTQDAKKVMDEQYQGEYTSLKDYAYQFVSDIMEISENIEPYFDYEKFGRDMELSGDIFIIEVDYRKIHVFWSY